MKNKSFRKTLENTAFTKKIKAIFKKPIAIVYFIIAVLFWLVAWHLLAIKVDNALFLPTPSKVWTTLKEVCLQDSFKASLLYSITNISKGFFLAVLAGILLAIISSIHPLLEAIIKLPIRIIKAIPVASFTILALLWIDSIHLSILVSFLMGLPIMYTNIYKGIHQTSKDLLEMSYVFRMPLHKRLRFIYTPSVVPFFISAVEVTSGMCWKSGIAAEVIGIAKNSIGHQLYTSKLYLEISQLFAYTIVIIICSMLFEKIVHIGFSLLCHVITSTFLRHIRPSLYGSKGTTEPLSISIRDLSVGYAPDKEVLHKLSLELSARTTSVIMAPSGAGKSTLIKAIINADSRGCAADISNPKALTEGCIKNSIFKDLRSLDGNIQFGISSPNSQAVKPVFSVVFQEDRLLENSTIFTNLAAAINGKQYISKQSLIEELSALGLEPHILDTCCNKLSGGMKRRIAILRAMLAPSNIVILDEPLKGLDEALKQDVITYIKKKTAQKTVLLITHDISEAEAFTASADILHIS